MRVFRDLPIEEIVIPEGVQTIGLEAFIGCNRLTSITLPNSVTEIITRDGRGPFEGCSQLAHILLKGSREQAQRLKDKITRTGTKAEIVFMIDEYDGRKRK